MYKGILKLLNVVHTMNTITLCVSGCPEGMKSSTSDGANSIKMHCIYSKLFQNINYRVYHKILSNTHTIMLTRATTMQSPMSTWRTSGMTEVVKLVLYFLLSLSWYLSTIVLTYSCIEGGGPTSNSS